jgi:flagellar biosynthesis/type III secretory pathway protein FliH
LKRGYFKGDAVVAGAPRRLACGTGVPPSNHPLDQLLEKDDVLRRYSEEALRNIVERCIQKAESLVSNARSESEMIIAAAKRTADEIVSQAKAEAGAIRAKMAAEAKTIAESEAESVRASVRDEIVHKYMAGLASLNRASDAVEEFRDSHLKRLESVLANAIGSICRSLLQRELTCEPSIVAKLVSHSLRYFDSGARLVVKVNPLQYEVITRDPMFEGAIRELGLGSGQLEFAPDSSIGSGGVIVTDRHVCVDLTFDRMIAEYLDEITTEMNRLDNCAAGEDSAENKSSFFESGA